MIRRLALVPLILLAACSSDELNIESGAVGQRISRSICPALAVPSQTGDVTLFDPPASREAAAIDVVATVTDLRGTCDEAANAAMLTSAVTFRVDARRERTAGARQVVLPYFVTVVRGGTQVVSKQVGQVALSFADGQPRASAAVSASAAVQRAAASLPEDVRAKVTRKRKPEDADASLDPLADPAVREAVRRASFEVLVGFQLTDAQLAYNATR